MNYEKEYRSFLIRSSVRHIHDVIRDRLLLNAGIFRVGYTDLPTLYRTQWSPVFEKLMRNRLVVGACRYGSFSEKYWNSVQYRYIPGAIARLQRYLRDGNLEHLVDAANLCMVEYVYPVCHRNPCFRSIDDKPEKERVQKC
jgi:hypothetical protein